MFQKKKCLRIAGFLQPGAIYATITHVPGVNIIGRKVSVASINGAEGGGGRKPGVVKPHQGVKGCCPLRMFVGSK